MPNETIADAIACQARATAWELMAFSLRYPDAELSAAVASGEWADAAREATGALGLVLPAGWGSGLASYVGHDPNALLHVLRAEATRLFVGAPEPVASPYEGVHRAAEDGVQALLFVNPHSMDVERFARACGLGRPEGTNEPLDHAATECELLQYLCMLECGMAEAPGGLAPAGLPDGSPAAAYGRFLAEHARAWMPAFAEAVAAESREPFYRAAAQLLAAMVEAA